MKFTGPVLEDVELFLELAEDEDFVVEVEEAGDELFEEEHFAGLGDEGLHGFGVV